MTTPGKKRSLYDLYMDADAAVRDHDATCATCSPAGRCATGRGLFAEFARLQDDQLDQQKTKRT